MVFRKPYLKNEKCNTDSYSLIKEHTLKENVLELQCSTKDEHWIIPIPKFLGKSKDLATSNTFSIAFKLRYFNKY